MTRIIKASDRRAMADAIRHMRSAGERFLPQSTGATPWQIAKSLNTVLLPGRDGIGLRPSAGVVSPRHDYSPAGGDLLPVSVGANGVHAPVVPTSLSNSDQGLDGLGERCARAVIDRDLLHADHLARVSSPVIGNAGKVLPCAR